MMGGQEGTRGGGGETVPLGGGGGERLRGGEGGGEGARQGGRSEGVGGGGAGGVVCPLGGGGGPLGPEEPEEGGGGGRGCAVTVPREASKTRDRESAAAAVVEPGAGMVAVKATIPVRFINKH